MVCNEIVKHLNTPWVFQLSLDRFYKNLTPEQTEHVSSHNFDHPDAFDWDEFETVVKEIKTGKSVVVPVYSFQTNSRLDVTETLYGADVVLIEGILLLYNKKIRDQLDMKIFVDCDDDLRLARRVQRDVLERKRTVDSVLHQYISTVKPSFDDFIAPTKRYADIIIPRGGENIVAINLIAQHIQQKLKGRGVEFKDAKARERSTTLIDLHHLDPRILVLHAIASEMTCVRDPLSSAESFSRSVRVVGQSVLTAAFKMLSSPSSSGVQERKQCVVTIVPGGKPLENILLAVNPEVSLGSLMIQQLHGGDKQQGPRLQYLELPVNVKECSVLLLDTTVVRLLSRSYCNCRL